MRTLVEVRCSCGRVHTSDQFKRLPLCGYQADGDGGELELRTCPCGSTHTSPEPLEAAS